MSWESSACRRREESLAFHDSSLAVYFARLSLIPRVCGHHEEGTSSSSSPSFLSRSSGESRTEVSGESEEPAGAMFSPCFGEDESRGKGRNRLIVSAHPGIDCSLYAESRQQESGWESRVKPESRSRRFVLTTGTSEVKTGIMGSCARCLLCLLSVPVHWHTSRDCDNSLASCVSGWDAGCDSFACIPLLPAFCLTSCAQVRGLHYPLLAEEAQALGNKLTA